MARSFVPATLSVGSEAAQMVKLYDRQEETKPGNGYRILGQVVIGGVAHYVTGFVSPANASKAASVKGKKKSATL
jgi:hypothetical protein